MEKNTKLLLTLLVVGLVCILLFFVFKKTTYTVTFETNGGSSVKSIKVEKGNIVSEPTTEKEGFVFVGWYFGNTKYDFSTKITKDLVLNAKWAESISGDNTIKETYTVTFDSDGGSAMQPISIKKGERVQYPEAPTKDNYEFTGWYLNGSVFDLNTIISGNITLKAQWKEVKAGTKTITLNYSSTSIEIGETKNLTATLKNITGTVIWSTNNANVATVSSIGKVTAKSEGTAIITAKVENTDVSANCIVKVTKTILATGITLNKTSLSLTEGDSTTLEITFIPSNTTNKSISWKSSNSNVATVSNGKITAKSVGETTITATTSNGKIATSTVTVKAKPVIEATEVTLNKTSQTLEIGEKVTLTAIVEPANATNKLFTWSSSSTSVATVSNGTVTAVSGGTSTITVKTSNGKTATCTIKVNPKADVYTYKIGEDYDMGFKKVIIYKNGTELGSGASILDKDYNNLGIYSNKAKAYTVNKSDENNIYYVLIGEKAIKMEVEQNES